LTITLNGDRFEIARPLTVSELLVQLDIDARRVAVEHNLTVLKRQAFDRVVIQEGDSVEIVNFVGGGEDEGPRTKDGRHGYVPDRR